MKPFALLGRTAVFAIASALAATTSAATPYVWEPWSLPGALTYTPNRLAIQGTAGYGLVSPAFYRTLDGVNWSELTDSHPTADWSLQGLSPVIATPTSVLVRTGNWGWGISHDKGATWSFEGSPDMVGNPTRPLVGSQAFDAVATSSGYYAADRFGVIKSTDGVNWSRVRDVRGTANNLHVQSIAALGDYLFTSRNSEIARSDDGGATWTAVSSPVSEVIFVEDASLEASGTALYAVVRRSLYKTTDLGATWTTIDLTGVPGLNVWDVETVGNHVFIENGAGVFQTDNDGVTWVERNAGLPGSGAHIGNGSLVEAGGRLYASYEGGEPRVFVMSVPEPSTYALMLAGLVLIGLAARRRRWS